MKILLEEKDDRLKLTGKIPKNPCFELLHLIIFSISSSNIPKQKMGESKACGAKWRCLAADLSDMEGNDQYNHAPPNTSV